MSNSLRVAELDFDTIKDNLKDFLRNKPEFTDYDYEGSGLSVLMDLLAYNTHYNAVIANMLLQEVYLDTAVKKQSLALIAKRLGYTPGSYRAAKAVVDLEVFPTDQPDVLTIGRNAKFTTYIDFSSVATFVTKEARTINRGSDGRYIFTNLEIYEGTAETFRYTVTDPVNQRFEIPSKLVDTTILKIYIQENASSTNITEWKRSNTIVDIKSDSEVYFLKLNESLNYEVYFGDGVIGKAIIPGNRVIIEYFVTNGDVVNGASSFTFSDYVDGYSNTKVTTIASAFGGAQPESLDAIRINAQQKVLSQNRAVTESDYAQIIKEIVPISTISVFGGETMDPPVYGRVYISAKQENTTFPLTETQKQLIITELKKRSVMGVSHEFIDPIYINLLITTEVKYDTLSTTLSADTMKTKIFNAISQYGVTNLNRFNSTFEYSDLVGYIDEIDRAIISNDTTIKLRGSVSLTHNMVSKYSVNFFTSIKESNSRESNIVTTGFMHSDYNAALSYIGDSNGILHLYQILNNQKVIVNSNIGTVDYTTGKLEFTLNTLSTGSPSIQVTAVPVNRNVIPSSYNILSLENSDIQVTLKAA